MTSLDKYNKLKLKYKEKRYSNVFDPKLDPIMKNSEELDKILNPTLKIVPIKHKNNK